MVMALAELERLEKTHAEAVATDPTADPIYDAFPDMALALRMARWQAEFWSLAKTTAAMERNAAQAEVERLTVERDEARAEVARLQEALDIQTPKAALGQLAWEVERLSEKLEWGPDEGYMTWDEAIKLAASKVDGWRLPTVAELVSQYDYDNGNPAAGFRRDWYWSSSPGDSSSAWGVGFGNGLVFTNLRYYESGVRCVREKK